MLLKVLELGMRRGLEGGCAGEGEFGMEEGEEGRRDGVVVLLEWGLGD